jgi:hypothetical protein
MDFRKRRFEELLQLGFSRRDAHGQVEDELVRAVLRARRSGSTLSAIGERIGLSRERVRQLQKVAERRERAREKGFRAWAPLLQISDPINVRMELRQFVKACRSAS